MKDILQRKLLSALVIFLIGVLVVGPVGPAVAFAQTNPVPSLGCLGSCPISSVPSQAPCTVKHTQAAGAYGMFGHNSFSFFEFFFFLLFLLFGMMGGTGGTPAPVPAPEPSPIAGTPSTPSAPCPPAAQPSTAPIALQPSPSVSAVPLSQAPLPSSPVLSSTPVISAQPSIVPSSMPVSSPPVPPISAAPADQVGGPWAGYVYGVPSGTTKAVISSTWKMSPVDCSQGDGTAAPWIGFGGFDQSDQQIAQLGVEFKCSNSALTYTPWTEAFPAPPVNHPEDPAEAGDQISTSVAFNGNGEFATTMTNETKGWTISVPMSFSGWTPKNGEYIIEVKQDNSGNGLPKYDPPITLSKNMYSFNGGVEKELVTAPKLNRVDLTNQEGTQQTITSPVVGGTFSIGWLHY